MMFLSFFAYICQRKAEDDMKGIIIGPAGGQTISHIQGTKVTLAGRTAYLPNDNVPFVLQRLTAGQINAIPKDRFAVSLIEVPKKMAMAGPVKKGRGSTTLKGFQRLKTLSPTGGGATGFVRVPAGIITAGEDGTKQYTTMVTLIDQIRQKTESFYDTTLKLSRNQRNNPPEPDSDLFYPPIDDGSMSDCIKKAIAHFFGEKDSCKICGKVYKPVVFCLLMHDYFIRMHILKNITRTPFCEYLQKRVLKKEMMFTSRTFTGYANDYKDTEQDFTDSGKLKLNFNVHPEPSGKPLQDAFHEIGHYFHTSGYFKRLRMMRDNMRGFMI